MRVVIRRVLERAALRPAVRRAERGARSGVTYAPANGVRVVQEGPPRAPS
jgi:hypothetical protein